MYLELETNKCSKTSSHIKALLGTGSVSRHRKLFWPTRHFLKSPRTERYMSILSRNYSTTCWQQGESVVGQLSFYLNFHSNIVKHYVWYIGELTPSGHRKYVNLIWVVFSSLMLKTRFFSLKKTGLYFIYCRLIMDLCFRPTTVCLSVMLQSSFTYNI